MDGKWHLAIVQLEAPLALGLEGKSCRNFRRRATEGFANLLCQLAPPDILGHKRRKPGDQLEVTVGNIGAFFGIADGESAAADFFA